MNKLIFLDTETTSDNPSKAGMWQLGGIIECGKRQEKFLLECDIFEGDEVTKEALTVGNITMAELSTYANPADIHDQFIKTLDKYVDRYDKSDKFTVIGYFAEFDQKVLRKWFDQNDDEFFGSWFYHPWVDVAQMLNLYLLRSGKRNTFDSFKLNNVATALNIDYNQQSLHNALYDSKITRDIYYKICELMFPI